LRGAKRDNELAPRRQDYATWSATPIGQLTPVPPRPQ
jgi:hypothetical protein